MLSGPFGPGRFGLHVSVPTPGRRTYGGVVTGTAAQVNRRVLWRALLTVLTLAAIVLPYTAECRDCVVRPFSPLGHRLVSIDRATDAGQPRDADRVTDAGLATDAVGLMRAGHGAGQATDADHVLRTDHGATDAVGVMPADHGAGQATDADHVMRTDRVTNAGAGHVMSGRSIPVRAGPGRGRPAGPAPEAGTGAAGSTTATVLRPCAMALTSVATTTPSPHGPARDHPAAPGVVPFRPGYASVSWIPLLSPASLCVLRT